MRFLSLLCCCNRTTPQDPKPPKAPSLREEGLSSGSSGDRKANETRALDQALDMPRRGTSSSNKSSTRALSFSSLTHRSSRRNTGSIYEHPISEMLSNEDRDDIRSELMDAMENHETHHCFIPISTLKSLVNRKIAVIRKRHNNNPQARVLGSFFCEEAITVFAMLIWIERVDLLDEFYTSGFTDKMLPVVKDPKDGVIKPLEPDATKAGIVRKVFEARWENFLKETFYKSLQWQFLAPVFEEEKFFYTFHKQCHMPFLDPEGRPTEKESNFSVVHERIIHKDHLLVASDTRLSRDAQGHARVAVKRLKAMEKPGENLEAAAIAEAEALQMIRNLKHPHLIRAIAYYQKGREHYFVFPWAGEGNLRDFWSNDPPKSLDRPYFDWAFKQLYGLAHAIHTLHNSFQNLTCRHGDLKPENILCFEDTAGSRRPWLIIADVGLARIHETATRDRKEATRTMSGTVLYEPPESELNQHAPRSRRYDIWSIGCIYLEFIIWTLYGTGELGRFRADLGSTGKFYELVTTEGGKIRTARINTNVDKWINAVRNDPRCPEKTAIRSLLEHIRDRLLVVDVIIKDTGDVNKSSKSVVHDVRGSGTPSVLVRAATMPQDSGPDYKPAGTDRASAEEMESCLKGIKTRASGKNPEIEWIHWKGTPTPGPGKYGKHLSPSQAGFGSSLGPDSKAGEQLEIPSIGANRQDNKEYVRGARGQYAVGSS